MNYMLSYTDFFPPMMTFNWLLRTEIRFKTSTSTAFSVKNLVFLKTWKKRSIAQFVNNSTCQCHVFTNKNEFENVSDKSHFRFENSFKRENMWSYKSSKIKARSCNVPLLFIFLLLSNIIENIMKFLHRPVGAFNQSNPII